MIVSFIQLLSFDILLYLSIVKRKSETYIKNKRTNGTGWYILVVIVTMSFAIPTLLLQSYNPDAFSKVCSFEGDVTRGNGKSVEYALKIGIAWLVTLLISSGVGFYCTYQVRKHVRTTTLASMKYTTTSASNYFCHQLAVFNILYTYS